MSARIDYTKVAPAGVKALGGVYGYIMQCGLSDVLVELVFLRISQINGCAYCLDQHTRVLQKNGVAVEKLALVQVWREAESGLKALLAWRRPVSQTSIINQHAQYSTRRSWSI